MKNIFYAKSNKGLLEFSNKREFYDYLLSVDDKKLVVTIERETGVRSFSQNNLLWAYMGIIADETGDNARDLHEYFKRKFLPPKFIKVLGKEVKIPASTTDLSKIDMGDYLDKISFLVEIPIPDPNKISL